MEYFTSGQVSKKLRISTSTLKRWLTLPEMENIEDRRNSSGWRLFTAKEIGMIKKYKIKAKKNGRRFNKTTLIPVQKG